MGLLSKINPHQVELLNCEEGTIEFFSGRGLIVVSILDFTVLKTHNNKWQKKQQI
jgi:hypothetical protein